MSTSRKPLDGIIVADFSRVLAGPYCSMLLADMGATVIKVESPQGDDTRTWTPPTHNDVATYYMSINRNKRSIVLDFASEEDRKVGLDLIKRADIFIENFKTKLLESTCFEVFNEDVGALDEIKADFAIFFKSKIEHD